MVPDSPKHAGSADGGAGGAADRREAMDEGSAGGASPSDCSPALRRR